MYSSQSESGGDPNHLSSVRMRLPLICTVFKMELEDEHDVDASDVSGEFGSDWITLFAGVVGSLIVEDQFNTQLLLKND